MTINPITPKVSEAEKRFLARTFNSDLVTEFVIQALNDIYENPSKDSASSSPTSTRSSDTQDFWSDFELESEGTSSPQNEPVAAQKQPAKSVYSTARTSSKTQELLEELESYNQTKTPEETPSEANTPVVVSQENLKPTDVINDNLAKVKAAVQIAAQQGLTSFNSFKGSVTSVLNKIKQ